VNRFARLTAANAVDGTFAGGTRANGAITHLAVQPDGKLVLGGGFTAYNGSARNRVLRVNGDGSIDTTFQPGEGPLFPDPTVSTPLGQRRCGAARWWHRGGWPLAHFQWLAFFAGGAADADRRDRLPMGAAAAGCGLPAWCNFPACWHCPMDGFWS
jgi:hypothetical protein